MQTLLGTKSNMTAVFNHFGHRIPVTIVVAEPNVVVELLEDKILLGLGKKKKSKKTENKQIKDIGYSPKHIKEVTIEKSAETEKPQKSPQENSPESQSGKKIKIGDKITVSIFQPGDEVKVTGTTKGKGFAGVVKRWGFHGGPKTHGQSDRHRAPGSIGMGTTPGRVFRGKKMAGHMGNAKLTVTGLEIMEVDESKNLLLIKGALPGPTNGFVIVEKTGKAKGYTPPPPPSEEKQAEKEAKAEAKQAEEDQKDGGKNEEKQKADTNDEKSAEKQKAKPIDVVKEDKEKENAKS